MVLATGCGRIGFDATAKGDATADGPALAEHACNTAINLGPLLPAPSPSVGTESWIATAAQGSRILLAESTTAGLVIVPIDLGEAPPVMRTAVSPAPVIGNNLQIAVAGDRVLISGSRTGGTDLVMTTAELATIGTRYDTNLVTAAPDHAVAHPAGGFAVVSSNNNVGRLDRVDRDGVRQPGAMWAMPNVRGASLAALGPDRFVAVWDTITTKVCTVRVLDAAFTELAIKTINPCEFVRVAAVADGSALAVFFAAGAGLSTVAFTPDLQTASPVAIVVPGHFNPSRTIGDATGLWGVVPLSTSSLHAGRVSAQGVATADLPLTPFSTDTTVFGYDVVSIGDRVYAVWLDRLASPSLYVERLCP